MRHTIWDVLSVWWIVLLIDFSVTYMIVYITKDK